MSFLSQIPAEIQSVLLEGIEELARAAWHKITGEHDDTTAKSVATHTAEHFAQDLLQKAENKLGALALAEELKKLGGRAAEMGPWADDMIAKIKKMNEDDRKAFSMPSVAFDNSDTPVEDPEKK